MPGEVDGVVLRAFRLAAALLSLPLSRVNPVAAEDVADHD